MDYTRPHSTTPAPRAEYTEYRDAYGTVGLLEEPSRDGAWLLTTDPAPVEE